MDLTDSQIERYSRQILLREVGGEGQGKILAARVLVVGGGPVARITALYLGAAGVGEIGLVDEAGGEALAAEIHAVNPECRVAPLAAAALSPEVIGAYPLSIVTCARGDLHATLSRAAITAERPILVGACGGDSGHVAVLHPRDGAGCLACIEWPPLPLTATPLAPSVAGAVGTLLATEALKTITEVGDPLTGRLLRIDAGASVFATEALRRRTPCPVCAAT